MSRLDNVLTGAISFGMTGAALFGLRGAIMGLVLGGLVGSRATVAGRP